VENLTRKSQLQEDELAKTTKQLKEAIAIASEETAKCKAAKEVIKSLTAQVEIPIPQTTFNKLIHVTWPAFYSGKWLVKNFHSNKPTNISLKNLIQAFEPCLTEQAVKLH